MATDVADTAATSSAVLTTTKPTPVGKRASLASLYENQNLKWYCYYH
jgi:hypothetical protein